MNKKRVLVGSPVYQKPEILDAFLKSLKSLNKDTISIDYMFVDDNIDEKSSNLLSNFEREGSLVVVVPGGKQDVYLCNGSTHYWNNDLVLKVATYKNHIINYAIAEQYDYLFFVDSDLILHPNLIEHLKSASKDIISEIFWTNWHVDKPLEPNVWLFDDYDLVPKKFGETLTEEEMSIRKDQFISKLKVPGVYEVGGLGACTLISRNALVAGVSFQPIKNLTIVGEDRFFCIRAAVLGIGLFVDTHYPAYHIYREKDLDGVEDYVQTSNAFVRQYKASGNKLTLSMIVKNEGKRYLKRVLNSLIGHIDEAVIIDDGSTDDTIQICQEMLRGIPLHIIKNEQSMFANESDLRKKQWNETIKTNPDWILSLDADEIIEDGFWDNADSILNSCDIDFCFFRLYDMWDENHYREDEHWNAHSIYRPFMMKYQKNFNYIWSEMHQHCGRFPVNSMSFPKTTSKFRVKHLGWATISDRKSKYERYKLLDPGAIYGSQEQYDSIMDVSPKLAKWEDACNMKG